MNINSEGDNQFDRIGFYVIVINKNMITYINYYQIYIGSVTVINTTSANVF
jgi:hypothetical protein